MPSIVGCCPRARIQPTHRLLAAAARTSPLIVAQLSAALAGIEIIPSEALGVPGDAKEALCLCIVGQRNRAWPRRANLPSATGALRPAVLGKICLAPPAR